MWPLIRPYRSTSLTPIATDWVAWSVRLSVCNDCEPCKYGWTDRVEVWDVDSSGPEELYIRWVQIPHEKWQSFDGDEAEAVECHIKFSKWKIPLRCGFSSKFFDHLLWPPCVVADGDIICLSCFFFLLLSSSFSLFFLAQSQRSQIACLPYLYTWCGPSVNLECRSEMCCRWLAGNARPNKKNSSGDDVANVNFLRRHLQPLLRSAQRKLPNSVK